MFVRLVHWLCCLLIIVSVAGLASSAQAQRKRSKNQSSENRERALVLFERSEMLYQEGKFNEAAIMLQEAYDLEKEPILLYNLARTLESAGRLEDAIGAYQQYLNDGPSKDKEKAAIEARIKNLQTRLSEEERIRKERDEARERQKEAEQRLLKRANEGGTRPADDSISPWPWVVAAVGVIGIGAGTVLAVMSSNKHDEAKRETVQQTAQELQNESEDLNTASIVSFIAGGALAAAGITWGVIDIVGNSNPSSAEAAAPVKKGDKNKNSVPANKSDKKLSLHLLPTSISLQGRF